MFWKHESFPKYRLGKGLFRILNKDYDFELSFRKSDFQNSEHIPTFLYNEYY